MKSRPEQEFLNSDPFDPLEFPISTIFKYGQTPKQWCHEASNVVTTKRKKEKNVKQ